MTVRNFFREKWNNFERILHDRGRRTNGEQRNVGKKNERRKKNNAIRKKFR